MNGIMVVGCFNRLTHGGMDREIALRRTCELQMRPVLMTCIAACVGLKNVTTGDTISDPGKPVVLESMDFPAPVIALAVEPKTKSDQEKLGQGLAKLMQEDPTFRVETDKGVWQTRNLVIATGDAQVPSIPRLSDQVRHPRKRRS